MPIYQYKCAECEHQLEALQRMSDAKLLDCPACNKPALKKQLTAAAFKLKGTGWYETDFKNSGAKPAEQKTTTSDTASESSGDGANSSVSASKTDASEGQSSSSGTNA